MTDKKRRQRGSRTHGGGSHKHNRGAGNRGGRGAAGRDKHERQLYGPMGKEGFTRPEDATHEVRSINVGELDEDVLLYVADGVAEEVASGYAVDARDVVEDGHEADVVKVLGGGRVHNQLQVTADAFSDTARNLIANAGGETHLSDRAQQRRTEAETENDSDGETDI
jgi:large subunit ribosomal protein L15